MKNICRYNSYFDWKHRPVVFAITKLLFVLLLHTIYNEISIIQNVHGFYINPSTTTTISKTDRCCRTSAYYYYPITRTTKQQTIIFPSQQQPTRTKQKSEHRMEMMIPSSMDVSSSSSSPFVLSSLNSFLLTSSTVVISDDNVVVDAISSSLTETWRQYVPLIVSFAVIIDILLGNPFLTLIRNIIFKQQPEGMDDRTKTPQNFNDRIMSSNNNNQMKERIDSKKVADEAIQKAKYTLELRNYLDKMKTDQQKMNEMKDILDQQLKEFDNKEINK